MIFLVTNTINDLILYLGSEGACFRFLNISFNDNIFHDTKLILDYNAVVGKINDHEYILVSTQKIKAQAYLNQCFLVLQIQAQQ